MTCVKLLNWPDTNKCAYCWKKLWWSWLWKVACQFIKSKRRSQCLHAGLETNRTGVRTSQKSWACFTNISPHCPKRPLFLYDQSCWKGHKAPNISFRGLRPSGTINSAYFFRVFLSPLLPLDLWCSIMILHLWWTLILKKRREISKKTLYKTSWEKDNESSPSLMQSRNSLLRLWLQLCIYLAWETFNLSCRSWLLNKFSKLTNSSTALFLMYVSPPLSFPLVSSVKAAQGLSDLQARASMHLCWALGPYFVRSLWIMLPPMYAKISQSASSTLLSVTAVHLLPSGQFLETIHVKNLMHINVLTDKGSDGIWIVLTVEWKLIHDVSLRLLKGPVLLKQDESGLMDCRISSAKHSGQNKKK